MPSKVLFVGNEPKVTRAMTHTLRKEKYEILSTTSAKRGPGNTGT